MRKFVRANLDLMLVLFLALLVRLWGIKHGLPFIYHPDEPALVRSAYGLRFGNLNPGHFDWPHFHYYLSFIVFESFVKFRALLQVLNLRSPVEGLAPLLWQDPAIFYLLGRLIAGLFSVLTVALIYFVGKRLRDRRTGFLAALFLAVSPLHVGQSHFALLDAPMTFWLVLSFYFSVLILESGRWRDYFFSGLFAGIAASTKYHGALVVVAIAAAHVLRVGFVGHVSFVRRFLADWSKLVLSGVVAIGGFFLGTPYALLDWETFTFKEDARGFLWQLQSMQGHLGAEAANGWWFHFSTTLQRGLGVALLGLTVLGVLLALYRHRRRDLLLLSFPIVYFFYVGSWTVVYGRFMLPVLPMLTLLAASSFLFLVNRVPLRNKSVFMFTLTLLVIAQPVWDVVKSDYVFAQKDTRTLAKEWIDENLPDKSTIAMDTIYGFFLDPFYLPNLRKSRGNDDPEKGFYLLPWSKISMTTPHEDPEKFLADWREEGVDYLITSSFVYGRYFSKSTEELRPGVKDVQDDYRWFDANFTLLKQITPQNQPGPTIKIHQVR